MKNTKEAHYIYQKEYTGDDTISVYLNFYAATYSTRFGYVKDESAWMSDAKIDLKLNDNSDYSVVKYNVPHFCIFHNQNSAMCASKFRLILPCQSHLNLA